MTTLFISHSSKDKAWAERTNAVLKADQYQCVFLDSHPDDGIHAGADWEQTLYQKLRQSRGIVVLCSANWLASPWCVTEAMIARERGKRVFLVAAEDVADDRQIKVANADPRQRIPDFLKDKQLVSLASMSEDEANAALLRGLEKEGLKKENFRLPDLPYPGLRAFEETDAAVYFGRDGEIDEVRAVLNRRRSKNAHGFVLVLGASGCGKSSLVRAGVLPQLRRASGTGHVQSPWVIVPPMMAGRGLDGLALALAQAFKDAGRPQGYADVRSRLGVAEDLRSLGNELLSARGAPDGAVLLIVDQLEEVFGTPEGPESHALLQLLLDASADVLASPIVVLATMRSDFLDAFQQVEVAGELQYEKVTLDPMPRSRFAEVIEGPADRFGLDLDPGLAERMAEDTAHKDALPLLAFTLEKLHRACIAGNRLTRKAYDALGGVTASIKHVADDVLKETGYAALPADHESMRELRRAFFRLAQVREEEQFTRRIASWDQMPEGCRPLLQEFVDQRLLVLDTVNGERVLSVAHEALFRVWETLNRWLHEDRKALLLRSQIEEAAAGWQAAGRDESRTWPEGRIIDTVREIEDSGVSLADVADPKTVMAFLGPTDPEELEALPALDHSHDAAMGSVLYGDAWRLPLSHEARASTGVRLDLLGDRRKGVGLQNDGLPDIDWVAVKGGQVTIDFRVYTNDPSKTLTRAVGPFWMARYPVTVAQFRAFLADCHRNGAWRFPPGFPNFQGDYPPPKHRARHGNHPADNVSWWDAAAFCHWLGTCLGYEVRLPTEFEWQQAATGGDPKRKYPWGSGWDPSRQPWRANTNESDLNRSTAVGMYPAGASAAGVQDMAGNVWEWCRNAVEVPDKTEFPGTQEGRVLRGGSWGSGRLEAGSTFRSGGIPVNRGGNLGFRVCLSPLSDH